MRHFETTSDIMGRHDTAWHTETEADIMRHYETL